MLSRAKQVLFRHTYAYYRDKARKKWRRESRNYFSLFKSNLSPNPLPSSLQLKSSGDLPSINLVILAGPLDVDHVCWSVSGAVRSSENPIDKILLVTPSFQVITLIERIANLQREIRARIEVVADEDILETISNWQEILRYFPKSRVNWYKQQMLKIVLSNISEKPTLILDAEHILITKRTWLVESGVQLIYINNDFNPPFNAMSEFFLSKKLPKIDFVAHGMLFQPDVIKEMTNGNLETFLRRWFIDGYSRFGHREISEWQLYGDLLTNVFEGRFVLGFQQMALLSDDKKLHQKSYQEIANAYGHLDSIYLIHKDKVHGHN